MNGQRRYAQVELRLDQAERTPEGYLRAIAPVTKTGVFAYKNSDGSMRWELRHPADVFSKASIDSLKMLPVQVEHRAMLDASNIDKYKVGHLGEAVEVDGNVLKIPIVVDGKAGLDAVAAGKKELSCGYTLDLEPAPQGSKYDGQPYTHRQTNIRYNHLAITDRARLGPDLRLDAADAVETDAQVPTPPEESRMKKVNIDGIEYDAAPEVANALSRAQAQVSTEKGRADAAEGKIAAKDAQIQTLTGERDGFKAQVSAADAKYSTLEASIPAKAAQLAKDRAAIDSVARDVLPEAQFVKSVGMDAATLRKEVIKAKFPSMSLDGMDDGFVSGVFASIAAGIKKTGTDAGAANRATSTGTTVADGEDRADAVETARLAMVKRNQDAWKTPK